MYWENDKLNNSNCRNTDRDRDFIQIVSGDVKYIFSTDYQGLKWF